MRKFDSGATRDDDTDKIDYEGFYSPRVIRRFGEYMHRHRVQADGQLRDSDNWQRGSGIPREAYMKSAWRHFLDWWSEHRGIPTPEGIEEAICALIFNAQGYLDTLLREKEQRAKADCHRSEVIGDLYLADFTHRCLQCLGPVRPPGHEGRSWCSNCQDYRIPITEETRTNAS